MCRFALTHGILFLLRGRLNHFGGGHHWNEGAGPHTQKEAWPAPKNQTRPLTPDPHPHHPQDLRAGNTPIYPDGTPLPDVRASTVECREGRLPGECRPQRSLEEEGQAEVENKGNVGVQPRDVLFFLVLLLSSSLFSLVSLVTSGSPR